jgi:ABC-type nitrate/sulfonate/bicarbonate transport system permease component
MEAGRQFIIGLAATAAMGNLIGYWSVFNLSVRKLLKPMDSVHFSHQASTFTGEHSLKKEA